MTGVFKAALGGMAASFALAMATTASAAAVNVDVDFLANGSSVATTSFSYDDAETGLLTFGDLDAFALTIDGGQTYDLPFLNSGGFTEFYYFGFDATSLSFTTANISGFDNILSAIKDGFGSGFFIRPVDSIPLVRDYAGSGEIAYDTININVSGAVPEPSTWALMIAGFGAAGSMVRRRRAVAA